MSRSACTAACPLVLVFVLASPAAASGGAPTLLAPGVVTTGDSESHATLSPDGASLYFVKLSPDFARWTVVVSKKTKTGWSEPEVAWFSGRWDDADVSFSPDGNTIWFISNRPDGDAKERREDTDIFRMKRTKTGWTEPERVRELSSPGNEWFPNQAASGTLHFGSERREGNLGPEGTADLWRARWLGDHFAAPESLGPMINAAGQDIEPWIAPDESFLVFAAKGRKDSKGSYDLYVSARKGETWSEPRPLGGGVNTAGWEFGARFSPDGKTFFYASNHASEPPSERLSGREGYARLLKERLRAPGNGLFDIYAIPTDALGLDEAMKASARVPESPR